MDVWTLEIIALDNINAHIFTSVSVLVITGHCSHLQMTPNRYT